MKERKQSRLENLIEDKVRPFLANLGYSLVETGFANIKGGSKVTLFLYSKSNMSVDDLARLSRKISPVLDELDFLKNDYLLELSSPGITRVFKSLREFDIFKGHTVKIVKDKEILIGECRGIENDYLLLMINNEINKINLESINKAKLYG
ncbi:MAG TPA: hypothetical protein PLG34_11310 [Spirochaetota bacterium]|jgi:ribosome maturation factor RimP|nr:MAG: Ribosome maturation factor RimP [Spirochaetes bacterium ADurb.Bin133]HNZ27269.1 hypothetical protein [Spirochaetota bacterium]HPY88557.1 hypothetical protein [Spirochaetota bacterium]